MHSSALYFAGVSLVNFDLRELLRLRDEYWPEREARMTDVVEGRLANPAATPSDPHLLDALATEVHNRDIEWHDFLTMRAPDDCG